MYATPLPHLVGRRRERAVLDDLVSGLRAGDSGVCVVRGEAGIGKSVLLEYVVAQASGATVTRALGVEADMELAYASLHQVCAPFLTRIEELPVPQRDALRVAFGLAAGDPPDRFLVGLAVLTLISRAGQARPLLVVVDDAQWLDRVSLQTMEFVARRLLAEAVTMVFAVREPEGEAVLLGLPELRLTGLDAGTAGELLESVFEVRLEDRIRERLIAETRGNPLALLELSRGRSAGEMAYGLEAADPGPVSDRVEREFARRWRSLLPQSRTLLLLAAAEPVGDARLLARAAELMGVRPDAGPAKAAGLIEFGESVRFRHPLARSAIYRAGTAEERRAVHAVLARATDPVLEPDRRAWHAAQACEGPDEEVATALEEAADRARQRGGMAAEAVLLERSTTLTPDPWRRGHRALAAAEAHFSAASPGRATELASLADLCPLSAIDHARLARLRARTLFALSRSDEAAPLLLDAAARFAAEGSPLARETYLEAISATVFAGRVHGPWGAEVAATAALTTDLLSPPSEPADRILEGVATVLSRGRESGFPLLREALTPFAGESLDSREATMRWLLLAPVVQETYVHQLWDFDAWEDLSARSVRLARDVGALGLLPLALMYAAGVDLHRGEIARAVTRIEESRAISAATGYAPLTYASLVLTAWRGEEDATLRLLDEARASVTERGEVSLIGVSGYVRGVLYNGLARYDVALSGAREGVDHDGFNFTGWALAEHIEAAVRCGELEQASESLVRLSQRTTAAATPWARGIQARCDALVEPGDGADGLYQEALGLLSRTGIAVQMARTHLLYGEWLRRIGRRVDARDQLRRAHEMFEGMRLTAFSERTRRELLATGERMRNRGADGMATLTPQETQIAGLAADGMTNPRIGAELFLSPHTVEWHLRKVSLKLGISSRRELPGALGTGGPAVRGRRTPAPG